jgi:alpha-ketoglutarate-dependent taurine dioxygenase
MTQGRSQPLGTDDGSSDPFSPSALDHPDYEVSWLNGRGLPLLITPKRESALCRLPDDLVRRLDALLPRVGAVLLRGFGLHEATEFRAFVAGFGQPLLSYEFGSTPRREIVSNVYSSTEYPPARSIPLHNEQSYTSKWPSRIWFHCVKAASEGGATPIADSRCVFNSIPPAIVEQFTRDGLLYVRNYGLALDVPWQHVFGTSDRATVAAYCEQNGIACEFRADGRLQTRERCQATLQHPVTGESVWFNQAHLFHVSGLDPKARQSISDFIPEDERPRNVFFGDGSPIDEASLDEVRDAYRRHAVAFPWRDGDVLMLDNIAVAHGRHSFTGERSVHVAMT